MTGLNTRHYDRADQGGSTESRPEQKMGRLRRWPNWYSPWVEAHLTTGVRQTLQRAMTKKRRQRDRRITEEES